jgi:hypothetical protein
MTVMAEISEKDVQYLFETIGKLMKENSGYREEVREVRETQKKQDEFLENILGNLSELTKNLQADSDNKIQWHDVAGVIVCSHDDAAVLLNWAPQTLHNKKKDLGLESYCKRQGKNYYRKSELLKIMRSEFKLTAHNSVGEFEISKDTVIPARSDRTLLSLCF